MTHRERPGGSSASGSLPVPSSAISTDPNPPQVIERETGDFDSGIEMRTPSEILRRAIVMTSVAFRASLEVSVHARCEELCGRLLPWLEEHGMAGEIDTTERELLATPFGQLDKSQQVDANWSGEGANIMCWALGLQSRPHYHEHVDYTHWFNQLGILRNDPLKVLSEVSPPLARRGVRVPRGN